MKIRRRARRALLTVAVVIGSALPLHLLVREAHAIIGMPLTPMSYAGVARRTTRRAAFYGAAASPYYW
jgi:hypothetical protein